VAIGSETIPESLKPLLEEGSDTSWNSAFVTMNSTDRKVLMPTNSSKNVSYKIRFSDVIRILKHLYNKLRML
jgi:hypothetical protein